MARKVKKLRLLTEEKKINNKEKTREIQNLKKNASTEEPMKSARWISIEIMYLDGYLFGLRLLFAINFLTFSTMCRTRQWSLPLAGL